LIGFPVAVHANRTMICSSLGTRHGPAAHLHSVSERVVVADRVIARIRVEIHPTREPDRILRQEEPDSYSVVPVPGGNVFSGKDFRSDRTSPRS